MQQAQIQVVQSSTAILVTFNVMWYQNVVHTTSVYQDSIFKTSLTGSE